MPATCRGCDEGEKSTVRKVIRVEVKVPGKWIRCCGACYLEVRDVEVRQGDADIVVAVDGVVAAAAELAVLDDDVGGRFEAHLGPKGDEASSMSEKKRCMRACSTDCESCLPFRSRVTPSAWMIIAAKWPRRNGVALYGAVLLSGNIHCSGAALESVPVGLNTMSVESLYVPGVEMM